MTDIANTIRIRIGNTSNINNHNHNDRNNAYANDMLMLMLLLMLMLVIMILLMRVSRCSIGVPIPPIVHQEYSLGTLGRLRFVSSQDERDAAQRAQPRHAAQPT